MIYKKCPVPLEKHPPWQSTRTGWWCSGKLPCGRCLLNEPCSIDEDNYRTYAVSDNNATDNRVDFDFDCDNCQYKWKCMTIVVEGKLEAGQVPNNREFLEACGLPYGSVIERENGSQRN